MCQVAYAAGLVRCYPGRVGAPSETRARRGADIRVLVALEDDYRVYRETIAAVLRVLRPGAEVESTAIEALEEELERFDPQVVICNGHKEVESGIGLAWIELSLDPAVPTKISFGSCSLERTNPGLKELLEVIDELRVTHQYWSEGAYSPKCLEEVFSEVQRYKPLSPHPGEREFGA
jgi:hypothetical protein